MPLRSPQTRAQLDKLQQRLAEHGVRLADELALSILQEVLSAAPPATDKTSHINRCLPTEADSNALGWTVEDVWAIRSDLTRQEAREVLAEVERYYDPTHAPDERELATAAYHLFPGHRFVPAWIKDSDVEVAIDLCTGRVYDDVLGKPQALLYPQYYHLKPNTQPLMLRVGSGGHMVSSALLGVSTAVRHQVFELAYQGHQTSNAKVMLGAFKQHETAA